MAVACVLVLLIGATPPKEKPWHLAKSIERAFKAIPAGKYLPAGCEQEFPYSDCSTLAALNFDTSTYAVEAFYMQSTEVSNLQYLHFLEAARSKGNGFYISMLPDTLVHRTRLSYGEPYVEYYLRHPAYRNYPVVGVSYTQALAFCSWLTEHYHSQPNRKFAKVQFTLPNVGQWVLAAKGGREYAVFPWGGPNLDCSEGGKRCNYKKVPQAHLVETETGDLERYSNVSTLVPLALRDRNTYYLQAPCTSYKPNDYGLYNMAGNVQELVREYGVAKGGGWDDTGYFMRLDVSQRYDSTTEVNAQRGFRVVMEVLEE